MGQVTVAFTARLRKGSGLACSEVVDGLVPYLTKAAAHFESTVPIYTFMPDHVHLIVRGSVGQSAPKLVMDEFKQRSGSWLKRQNLGFAWQRNYWDHIIKPDQDWKEQVNYIAYNPVRRGLIENFREWPYTGSIGHDLREILIEAAF